MLDGLVHVGWLVLVLGALLLVLVLFGYQNHRLRRLLGRAERRGQRRAEHAQDSREAILAGLAEGARLLFNHGDRQDVLQRALGALGRAVEADRVYVFENHRDPVSGRLLASQRYEWVAEGIEPQLHNPDMQGMDYDEVIPNFRNSLERGLAVHGRVEDIPEPERFLLLPQSIRSIAVVPIIVEGQFWGQIGFDDCSRGRSWSSAEINALGIAAATIGAAIRGIRAEQELANLANTDSLTGFSTRRQFLQQARAAHAEALGRDSSLALLVLDLDRFKAINDGHGHLVGDQALVWFSRVCRQCLRQEDLVGRLGGEEFAVLLREIKQQQALAVAEKLRSCLADSPMKSGDIEIRMSVSIGLAGLARGEDSFMGMLERADQALYQAKRNGRNRVEVAPDGVNPVA